MKNVFAKFNPLAMLTLILGIGLMSGSLAERKAMAGKLDLVPAIQVTGLQNSDGMYLHVLYVVGRPGVLSVSPIPYVDITRAQSTAIQISGNSVSFPAVEVERTLGRPSYNMIVLAISSSPQISWVNLDVNPNPTGYRFLHVIQRPAVEQFSMQNPGAAFGVNL